MELEKLNFHHSCNTACSVIYIFHSHTATTSEDAEGTKLLEFLYMK